VFSAEFYKLLFVVLLTAKEAKVDDDLLEIFRRVLGGNGLATGWAGVLLREILKEDVVVVLQDVEVKDCFRNRGLREHARKDVGLDLFRKLYRHLLLHELLEQLVKKEKRIPNLDTKLDAHPDECAQFVLQIVPHLFRGRSRFLLSQCLLLPPSDHPVDVPMD
jgi:hypothetical protein